MTLYERIYAIVKAVPFGRVATYGQIAKICGHCGARTVGYAMNAVKEDDGVPWFRIVNSKGKSSLGDEGAAVQKTILLQEGIEFNNNGSIDLNRFGWEGPTYEWMAKNGLL
jgi:methylated-DNA-protein-cysteine methyltransferase-like protein